MKLGEYETTANGFVKHHGRHELCAYPQQVVEFIRALHAAHERGEVVVMTPGTKLRYDYARNEIVAVQCPLTAEAIGEAVAKALTSNAIATYSDQMLRAMGDRIADAIGIAVARALEPRRGAPVSVTYPHSVIPTAELDALREVAAEAEAYLDVELEDDPTFADAECALQPLAAALARLDAARKL